MAQIGPMAIPVYCTSIRPVSGTANKIYETQVPVTCGGVVVDPGAYHPAHVIHADPRRSMQIHADPCRSMQIHAGRHYVGTPA